MQLLTDVSGQLLGPISKGLFGPPDPGRWDRRLSRNVGNYARNIPEERRLNYTAAEGRNLAGFSVFKAS